MTRMRALGLAAAAAVANAGRLGDSWGTNIHWTGESQSGEAAMLAAAFKLARMDFTWGGIEKSPSGCGSYDFSAYDGLLSIMKAHGIRPYWILDYGNACYPAAPGTPSSACNTAECIAAFGRFAAAAVNHFKGNGIIFECLNEPNGMGSDNATDITAVCLSASAPILAVPGEVFVGPTTAGMDWPYLNASFADGILAAFTSVSVHPYRNTPPDTVLDDYTTLRALIRQYAPAGKEDMGIISGEWGYTTALPPCSYGNRVDEITQAKYVSRMWLVNTLAGALPSIAYDWRDDGTDPTACESNFGSVRANTTGNPAQPFLTKPFYQAALTLQTSLGNAQAFSGRVQPSSILAPTVAPYEVFVLRFDTGTGTGTGMAGGAAMGASASGSTGNKHGLLSQVHHKAAIWAHPSPSSSAPAIPFTSGSGVAWAAWSNSTVNGTCAMPPPPSARYDCGYYGISEQTCLQRSCCWEPNQPKVGGPQCYYSKAPIAPFLLTWDASPAPPGTCWQAMDMLGNAQGGVCSDTTGIVTLQVSDAPVYLL